MKKFVLVPYAQFQRDKRRAEETLEKEQVPNFEKGPREISLPASEQTPPPPNGTLSLQGDSLEREVKKGPPVTVPQQEEQIGGDRKVTKRQRPLQFSESGEVAAGIKTPRVKRKRRVTPSKKITSLSDPQKTSSVEGGKNNGHVPAALQAPSAKFWIRP